MAWYFLSNPSSHYLVEPRLHINHFMLWVSLEIFLWIYAYLDDNPTKKIDLTKCFMEDYW